MIHYQGGILPFLFYLPSVGVDSLREYFIPLAFKSRFHFGRTSLPREVNRKSQKLLFSVQMVGKPWKCMHSLLRQSVSIHVSDSFFIACCCGFWISG